jgi:hypothetical protein
MLCIGSIFAPFLPVICIGLPAGFTNDGAPLGSIGSTEPSLRRTDGCHQLRCIRTKSHRHSTLQHRSDILAHRCKLTIRVLMARYVRYGGRSRGGDLALCIRREAEVCGGLERGIDDSVAGLLVVMHNIHRIRSRGKLERPRRSEIKAMESIIKNSPHHIFAENRNSGSLNSIADSRRCGDSSSEKEHSKADTSQIGRPAPNLLRFAALLPGANSPHHGPRPIVVWIKRE